MLTGRSHRLRTDSLQRRARARARVVTPLAALALLGVGCGSDPATTQETGNSTTASSAPTTTAEPTTTSTTPPTSGQGSGTTEPGIATTTTEPAPPFDFTASPIDDATRSTMSGISMSEGCPVGFDDLRLLHISHWNYAGQVDQGTLVVAASVVDDMRAVFERLFELRFPIERMEPVDRYGRGSSGGGDDWASIEANNTSAFNCRPRTGSTSEFSQHALGLAIDINPLHNPYAFDGNRTTHPKSEAYLDRSELRQGMVTEAVVAAFADAGWQWGGIWNGDKDYQHFSASGR